MAATNKSTFQPDSDVHITFEDQQKINKFARHNAKLEDYKEELKLKQNELKNMEDACEELELADDSESIPYYMGEIFVHQDLETAQKTLEEAKNNCINEISKLQENCTELRNIMSDLKSQLYAKFGTHINLEAEEE